MRVRWQDGWPRITDPGQVVPWTATKPKLPQQDLLPASTNGALTGRDDFNGTKLPLNWMMMRNPREQWWSLGEGMLTLQARPVALGDEGNPSFLARRQQHIDATATTSVRFVPKDGAEAGLVALQSDENWYFLAIANDAGKLVIRLRRRAGPQEPNVGTIMKEETLPVPSGAPLQLRAEARGAFYDFSWSSDGAHWHTLAKDADGTLLSTKGAGGFVGAMFGVHAYQPTTVGSEKGR